MATSQTVRKASRKKAKLRLGIAATAGAGKTMGSLLVAFGLTGDWGKVGLVDTESGSGELYVDHKVPGTTTVIGEYLYWRIDPPYTIAKYIEGQKALEEAGCEAIVLDSTTHAWAGAGGLLDKQGKIAAKSGNSYTAWRDVTPDHNLFVETMLSSPAHIIATMRSKTEYVLETNEKGRIVPRKIGMAPVQREGMDFEFTVMLDIDANHMASATKDRTSLFDGEFFKLSPETGKKLADWLNKGTETQAIPPPPPPAAKKTVRDILHEALAVCSTEEEVHAAAELPLVQRALEVAPDDVKEEIGAMLTEAMERVNGETV